MDLPLSGVRVLEVSHYIAGPLAGMILGGMGADVVKIESPRSPDPTRSFVYGMGLNLVTDGGKYMLWEAFNANKRAIALDITNPEGLAVLHKLVADADVFVTNLSLSTLERWGADFESLRAINPRIVYAAAEGLGSKGPRAGDKTMDTVGMAYSGLMYTVSDDQTRPTYPLGAMSDVQTGSNVASGVLAALLARDRTGNAQFVTSSQLQTLMWLQAYNIAVVANLGRNFNAKTNVSPFFGVYQCSDDHWIAVSVQHIQVQWPTLLGLFGFDDIAANPRYAARPVDGAIGQSDDPAEQKQISREVAEIMARGFRSRTRQEWLDLLRASGIGVGPVNTVHEVVADEHVAAERLLMDLDNGLVLARSPFSVDDMPTKGAPDHGADTFDVLRESGYTDEQIAELYMNAVVA